VRFLHATSNNYLILVTCLVPSIIPSPSTRLRVESQCRVHIPDLACNGLRKWEQPANHAGRINAAQAQEEHGRIPRTLLANLVANLSTSI
jgi:hypothetical protein